MGILSLLFGSGSGSGADPIESEKKRHANQVQTYQSDIDQDKRQIEIRKETIARHRQDKRGAAYVKPFIENEKKRIEDLKSRIERRKQDIAREKEQHKNTMLRLKKQK